MACLCCGLFDQALVLMDFSPPFGHGTREGRDIKWRGGRSFEPCGFGAKCRTTEGVLPVLRHHSLTETGSLLSPSHLHIYADSRPLTDPMR